MTDSPETPPARLAAAIADRYRIEGVLGEGGMATVYVAHDLRHDRKVALKVLRPELAAVIGAERFLAEIKTTAALQHPHILPLFDSGQVDSFLYYVMPLVEGESLRTRLQRETQLPIEDVVRIATEVGSALDYAHRHGVIHRDIKPENILLHDGQALVADFGIALAVSSADRGRMTGTGMSVGTPDYMSPEQATGERKLDARSDVYSLGTLVYEMIAGSPPHTGATMQAVIAAVVTRAPEPLSSRRPTVPPQIAAAVHRALAKLPADRFNSADTFIRAIGAPAVDPAGATMAIPSFTPAARLRGGRLAAILGAATIIFAVAAAWGWLRGGAPPPLTQYSLALPAEAAFQPGGPNLLLSLLAISPHGGRIVYVGKGEGTIRLFVKERDRARPEPIPGTEGMAEPFFSPDGKQLAYVKEGRSIRVVPLDGTAPRILTDSAATTAASWGTDGFIYFETDSGLARIPSGGGKIDRFYMISSARREVGVEFASLLPGGRGVIVRIRYQGGGPGDEQIVVIPRPAGEPRQLIRGIYARYSPSGHLLVVTADGKLLAVPFSERSLALTGAPVVLYDGLETAIYSSGIALSNSGTLVFQRLAKPVGREIDWVSREGKSTPVDSTWRAEGNVIGAALSPDGKAIAVELEQPPHTDIWVKRIPGGPFSRLTLGDTSSLHPSWSADGRAVLYVSDRGNLGGVPMSKSADGASAARPLFPSSWTFSEIEESPAGKWYVARRQTLEPGNGDIFGVKEGDSALAPLVASPARETSPAVSPDGRWLAYVSNETGAKEVYVRPFPDAAKARWQVSVAGGSEPAWSHSGGELYFRNGKGMFVAAAVVTSPVFSAAQQRALFNAAPYVASGSRTMYSVAPDDRRFLMLRETGGAAEGVELIVTENWTQALKAKAKP